VGLYIQCAGPDKKIVFERRKLLEKNSAVPLWMEGAALRTTA
jgi:hypothetical protein